MPTKQKAKAFAVFEQLPKVTSETLFTETWKVTRDVVECLSKWTVCEEVQQKKTWTQAVKGKKKIKQIPSNHLEAQMDTYTQNKHTLKKHFITDKTFCKIQLGKPEFVQKKNKNTSEVVKTLESVPQKYSDQSGALIQMDIPVKISQRHISYQ